MGTSQSDERVINSLSPQFLLGLMRVSAVKNKSINSISLVGRPGPVSKTQGD